ncbi:MAG: hypothetical protein LCH37_06850 [Bacteroidetes bacterium]|nr:hypothetical protein [Bacteroidota bacterium]
MKKLLFLLLSMSGIISQLQGQNLPDFKYLGDTYQKESYLNFSGMYVQLLNPAAPDDPALHAKGIFFVDLYYLRPSFEKGGLNRRVDYKLIPDLFWLMKTITEKDPRQMYANIGSTISGGLIGWHSWKWNLVAKPKTCISLGFAVNDYFIGAIYKDSSAGIRLHEPQGWQIGAGPAMGFSKALSKNFVLMGSGAYVINLFKPVDISYAKSDDAYPKPHMAHLELTLMSKTGLFLETQFVGLINQGNLPNSSMRTDFKLGFAFVL